MALAAFICMLTRRPCPQAGRLSGRQSRQRLEVGVNHGSPPWRRSLPFKIERSRVVPQPHTQGQRDSKLYHVTVEIDASVAGQASTYVYNCIRDGQLTLIQPLGM